MSTRFRWATTSARLAIGTAVSVAVVAGTVTAVAFAWPVHVREPVSVTATPAPAATAVQCAGPLLALGRDATAARGLSIAADQQLTSGTAPDGPQATAATLAVTGVDGSAPTVFTALPDADRRTDVAAAGSATASADDLRGFAASACTPPLLDSWIVGGSAATGASDLLLISNPGTVVASVALTVYGADGPLAPPAGTFTVAPGTQRVVPLAGLLLGEELPVVHVASTGAPVHAALQASITRTLVPGGVEQVGAIAAPEPVQVIPGVTVTTPPGEEGASDATTVLRILAPSAAATATVRVRAVDGTDDAIPAQTVPLEAGKPVGVELGGLPVGTYTVSVDADAAILAATWQTTGFGEGDDFAWYSAAPALAVDSLVAIADGAGRSLVLAADAGSDASVTLTDAAGAGTARQVTVPAGGSLNVDVVAGELYAITTEGAAVHAAVVYSSPGALSGYTVWPADAAASALVVYP